MTYQQLMDRLSKLERWQLDCDVTVEIGEEDCLKGEYYSAYLRMTGMDNDTLDENHPILFIND